MANLTTTEIWEYFKGNRSYKTKKEAVDSYRKLKVHAEGEYPAKIIDERRPNEPNDIKDYRKAIYEPKSQHSITKVLTTLPKIRRSQDWKTKWTETKQPAFIPKELSLQEYVEQNYPIYENFDNWLFDECLGQVMIDANCVICTIPYTMNTDPNSLEQPIMMVANSTDVLEHIEGELTIIKLPSKFTKYERGLETHNDVYVIFEKNMISTYVENTTNISEAGTYRLLFSYPHNLNDTGCFRAKGLYDKTIKGEILWKSPLAPMVPHLNEVAREYSDLQAEKVLHIFSEKWELNTNECKKCNGVGKVNKPGFQAGGPVMMDCPSCEGSGREVSSPFKSKVYNIDLRKLQGSFPLPPAGYIQKDTTITKILDEAIDKHLYQALESINMQFLAETKLAQSGIAKEWDREETSAFAYKVASIMTNIKKLAYYYINEYRYGFLVPDQKAREAMLPIITIPKKFDIITINGLIQQHKTGKEAQLSPVLIMAMEAEIAEKMFSDDPMVAIETKLRYQLDPLVGLSEDEKATRLSNNGITEQDYVISCNIGQFCKRAMQEDPQFPNKTYADQVEKMQEYAQEVIDSNSTRVQLQEALRIQNNGMPPAKKKPDQEEEPEPEPDPDQA